MREGCKNEDEWAEIEAALEPPNTVDPVSGVPYWYGSDEDAWALFEQTASRTAAR